MTTSYGPEEMIRSCTDSHPRKNYPITKQTSSAKEIFSAISYGLEISIIISAGNNLKIIKHDSGERKLRHKPGFQL